MADQEFVPVNGPALPMTTVFVLLSGLIVLADYATGFHFYEHYLGGDYGRVTFIAYLVMFAAFWIVYFNSYRRIFFGSQSLRVLLRMYSVQWGQCKDEQKGAQAYREKSRSTVTAMAIFIAISVLLIQSIFETMVAGNYTHSDWNGLVLHAALLFACMAFTIVLLSTDAVETTFNSFKQDELGILSYFYMFSAKLKYYGFVFMFLAVMLYVSRVSPEIAAFSTALFLVLGYSYWFPKMEREKWRSWARIALSIILLAVPFVAMFIDAA